MRKQTGCSRYDERPEICRNFECAWKSDPTYPEWMKPDSCNAVAVVRQIEGFKYVELVESAYAKTDTATLLHFIQWAHDTYGNIKVTINGGWRYFGTSDFCRAMQDQQS